jgi:MOSC domain-containing protein YiiM
MGHVFQINVSNGGVPKRAEPEAFVGVNGLARDAVAHPKIHGGPERAVCLYALDRIVALQAEGHPVFPGALGENLTLAGLDWPALAPEAILAVGGEVVLQLTRPTTPCNTIAPYFRGAKGFRRVDDARHPGWSRWYARVLREGTVRVGDAVDAGRGR